MTFEEAIEIIVEECGVEEGDGFFTNGRDLDTFLALSIIKNLQETYAPKIKMNSEQAEEFFEFLEDSNEGFPSFWFAYGEELLTLYRFSEKEIMQAWLHPELIEVVE